MVRSPLQHLLLAHLGAFKVVPETVPIGGVICGEACGEKQPVSSLGKVDASAETNYTYVRGRYDTEYNSTVPRYLNGPNKCVLPLVSQYYCNANYSKDTWAASSSEEIIMSSGQGGDRSSLSIRLFRQGIELKLLTESRPSP